MRKPKVNRDAARFFLRQPIRINARQRLDQCAFAVVHMAGGGEDEMFGVHDLSLVIIAWIVSLRHAARTYSESALRLFVRTETKETAFSDECPMFGATRGRRPHMADRNLPIGMPAKPSSAFSKGSFCKGSAGSAPRIGRPPTRKDTRF